MNKQIDLDYYEFITNYNVDEKKDLINKYFNKITRRDPEFNNLIEQAYEQGVRKVFPNFYELQSIMYMYYIMYMVELYMNQRNFASSSELKCLRTEISFDSDADVEGLYSYLPPIISTYTKEITRTRNFNSIFTNNKMNTIINHIYSLVKKYVNKCLKN